MLTRILAVALIGGAAASAKRGSSLPALQAEIDELERKLEVASARLDRLERSSENATRFVSNKVQAPFEVVDRAGKALIRVTQSAEHNGGVLAVLHGDKELAWISAPAAGGFFKAKSAGGFPEVAMGTLAGYGGLVIRDVAGQFRASLFLENGTPGLALKNSGHVSIALLKENSSNGGQLELGDKAGNAQMRAGVTPTGCGRVETYPERQSNAARLGMPVSFIVGNCK
jgi:hypothetical protein